MTLVRALGLGAATVLVSTLIGTLLAFLFVGGTLPALGPSLFNLMLIPGAIVFAGLLIVGLPVDRLLRGLEVRNPIAYAVVGAIGGYCIGATTGLAGWLWLEFFAPMGALFGTVTALVFWILFRRWRVEEVRA